MEENGQYWNYCFISNELCDRAAHTVDEQERNRQKVEPHERACMVWCCIASISPALEAAALCVNKRTCVIHRNAGFPDLCQLYIPNVYSHKIIPIRKCICMYYLNEIKCYSLHGICVCAFSTNWLFYLKATLLCFELYARLSSVCLAI